MVQLLLFSDSENNTPNIQYLRSRMGIINAFHLPGEKCEDLLYDSISPVNSFRLIFNCYFNTNFEYLDDLSFYYNQEKNDLINVTDIVRIANPN